MTEKLTMDTATLSTYIDSLETILDRHSGTVPSLTSVGPARITDFMYLGDFGDSNSPGHLSELGITHLLNCAGVYTGNRLMGSGTRKYLQLEAHDNEKYDMSAHFTEAHEYIDMTRAERGKVLVYCARGVNRSAAICVAYLIAREAMDVCSAVERVAFARGQVLTNPSFRKQLIELAAKRNRLQPLCPN